MSKKVRFLGDSRKRIVAFPEEARKKTGYQIRRLQEGEDPENWKPVPTAGKGVREIRIKVADGIYRTIYYCNFQEAIYILHAFQKKTQKTPLQDIRMARNRFNTLLKEPGHD